MLCNDVSRKSYRTDINADSEGAKEMVASHYSEFHAISIGKDALTNLKDKRTSGIIHSVFHHAVNITLHDGYFLTILPLKYYGVPFGIAVSLPENFSFLSTISAGDQVWLYDGNLYHEALCLEFGRAKVWEYERKVCRTIPALQTLRRNMEKVIHWIDNQPKKEGFFALFKYLKSKFSIRNPGYNRLEPLCACAGEKMELLYWSLINGEGSESLANMQQLVGLGAGLTPSGDDFLLGFFAINDHLNYTILPKGIVEYFSESIHVWGITTSVSEAYLKYGIRGQFTRILSEFTAALSGEDKKLLEQKTDQILNVGETSGLDMILGCLFGLQVCIKKVLKD